MSNLKSEFSRRKFIGASLGAVASVSLVGLNPTRVLAQDEKKPSEGKMVERTLGRTGLKVPVISMGAGAASDPGLVVEAFERGVRLFDTASSYQYGRNEQMVGNGLKKTGQREKAIIVTKTHAPEQRANLTPAEHKAKVAKAVDASLRRLKTDYIDVLLVHSLDDPATAKDQGIIDAMIAVKESGKVKFIGTSTHSHMADIVNASVEAKVWDVVLTSVNFTLADDPALLKSINNAAAKGVGIIGMKTQAGGARFPNPETLKNYDGDVINRAALKWALSHESITTTIPGFSNFEHLRKNVAVGANLAYSEEELKFLSDNKMTLGFEFCRQCGVCLASCPKGVDVPTLMRTHMYATQYGDFEKAKYTLSKIPNVQSIGSCGSCDACVAKCTNSVNIPRKIGDLSSIYS